MSLDRLLKRFKSTCICIKNTRTSRSNPIIESVDSISRDERGFPLTQYITNWRISRARYTTTHFEQHNRVLWPISNRMSV